MRRVALTLAALSAMAIWPALASADPLFLKVIEVSPGTGAGANGDYVELQMYAPGQNLVFGHPVKVYDELGAAVVYNLAANVPSGESQRTVLLGNPTGIPGGVTPDGPDASLEIPAAGGAVCFGDSPPADCVTWGSFAAQGVLPDPQTANFAGALPLSGSITRSIAPGCPTLLEDADDTQNSAVDFAASTPSPRNNATTPTETSCEPGPDPNPPPVDSTPPETTITKSPEDRTERTGARFKFGSSEPGSAFLCSRDDKPAKLCLSPLRYFDLRGGHHVFRVRAIDAAGNVDPIPAKDRWRIVG